MRVKLDDIIKALEFTNMEIKYYYHTKTESIVMVGSYIESDVTYDEIDENRDDYIPLPDRFDIDEYSIMEGFIYGLPEGRKKYILEDAIRGSGAFRRFKDKVSDLGLERKWYNYRDDEYIRIAKEWCSENNIEYVE